MTIKDLANKTGYSIGTVSRALNNHPNVSPKARAAILQAAKDSKFEINLNAKQLKQQRSSNILVVVKGTRNELFAELVEAIQNLIAQTPYQLVMDYEDENLNEVIRAVQLCREKKPRGILFLGGNGQNFAECFCSVDVPCVLVTGDGSRLPYPNLSSVSTNDYEAARAAINTLINMGHRKIAIIGGDREISDTSRLRYEGCMAAFREQGVEFKPEWYFPRSHYSYQNGYLAAKEMLALNEDFTAIFAVADVMAIGALRALGEQGKQVPEDISVMGVDGLPLGDYLVPQLATICQSVDQIARRSVDILLAGIEHKPGSVHETVPFTVKCRESIRPLFK